MLTVLLQVRYHREGQAQGGAHEPGSQRDVRAAAAATATAATCYEGSTGRGDEQAQGGHRGYEQMPGCTSKHRGWYNEHKQVRGVHGGGGDEHALGGGTNKRT